MSEYPTQLQRMGLAKESSRLTAESSPTKWHAIDPGSIMDYMRELIENIGLRAVGTRFAPFAGKKVGVGNLMFPVRAQQIGEYLHMLLGDPSSAQQAATAAYLHTWTLPITATQLDTYTLFMDRALGVLKYNGCSVSEIEFNQSEDGLLMAKVSLMFITEASGSIGSPSYAAESGVLSFQNLVVTIASAANEEVKQMNFTLSNGMERKKNLTANADAEDFLAVGPYVAKGSFVIYFANTTERDKFIAGSTTSLELVWTGANIESTYYYTLEMLFDDIRYKAFAYGAEDGLLAAKVEWEAYYYTSNSRAWRTRLTNTITSY